MALQGERHLHPRLQLEVGQGRQRGRGGGEHVGVEVADDQVDALLGGDLVGGDDDVVEQRVPGVGLAVEEQGPGAAVLVAPVDGLARVLVRRGAALGLAQAVAHLRHQADAQHMGDGGRHQVAGEAGEHQLALAEDLGHGQAEVGHRFFLLVGEGVEQRGLGGKGPADPVSAQPGEARSPGDDLGVVDPAVAGLGHQAADDGFFVTVEGVKDGNHGHGTPRQGRMVLGWADTPRGQRVSSSSVCSGGWIWRRALSTVG